jgi:hypothetical protein
VWGQSEARNILLLKQKLNPAKDLACGSSVD